MVVNENLSLEGVDKLDLVGLYRTTMHACFKLAFEVRTKFSPTSFQFSSLSCSTQYVRKVSYLLGEEMTHQSLGEEMLSFSRHWMIFVVTSCSRGHGISPR